VKEADAGATRIGGGGVGATEDWWGGGGCGGEGGGGCDSSFGLHDCLCRLSRCMLKRGLFTSPQFFI
jgi:hypothetical protein